MQNNQTSKPYNYIDAGFNRFFSRSINSNSSSGSLSMISHVAGSKMLNFDMLQTSGSLGDKVQIGRILLDGSNARIDMRAADSTDVELRLGEQDD